MRKNVSSQAIAIGMTSILSGTDYTNSGAVLAYLMRDASTIALGAVNSGICIPRSFGAHYYVPAGSETNFDHILFTFVASGAMTRHVNVYTERIGTPNGADLAADVNSIQVGVNSLYARIGAPVGASLAIDVASIQAGVNSLQPLPVSVGSVQTGVSSLLTATGSLGTAVGSVQIGVNSIYARIGENGINITSAAIAVTGVNSIAAQVNSNAAQINSNAISISSLHTRVSSNATAIGSVQTVTNSIYARIGENGINITSAFVVAFGVNSAAVQVGSINTAVGSLFTAVAATISSAQMTLNAQMLMNADMSVGVNSGSSTYRTPRQAWQFTRNRFEVLSGTLTVYMEDDATPSWTGVPVTTTDSAATIIGLNPTGP